MTPMSSNGNMFRVTGHLCGEFTGHRWIPCKKASDAELWFFSLICVWIYGWENNREAGDLRRYRVHFGVIVINANLLPNMPIGTHSSKVRIQVKWLLLTKLHLKNSPSFCSNFIVLTILTSVTAMPTNASLIHEPLIIWYCTERISKTS